MPDTARQKLLPAMFYRNAAGAEPVRKWHGNLPREDRQIIGQDIATVEFGWPVGMPLCRSLTSRRGLWEVRSSVSSGRIARVLFFTHRGQMVLLHGFVKQTQRTPDVDLDLAMKRKAEVERDSKAKK